MFCQNCGNQIPDGTNFCPNCGAGANQSAPPNYVQPIYVQKPIVPGRGLGIAAMVLGIIGAFYGFVEILSSVNALKSIDDIISSAEVKTGMISAFCVYAVLNILAVSFAVASRSKGYRNGISQSGLILGVIGLIFNIVSIFLIIAI